MRLQVAHARGRAPAARMQTVRFVSVREFCGYQVRLWRQQLLARSLNNLSVRLSAAEDHIAALQAIRDAVAIRRRLADANPARFGRDLAASLRNQAIIEKRARCSRGGG